VNAESAARDFQPNAGTITRWAPPVGPNIRLDTHCYEGYVVPIYYDSLLAKLLVYGSTRAEAVERMRRALDRFEVEGITTTLPFLRYLTASDEFAEGRVSTQLIDERLLSEYQADLKAPV
jgi:acetyl-CoA carboxylase biotin carboxylase subunit